MDAASTNVMIAMGVPTLTVLLGILINNSRIGDLRAHMNQRFDSMETNLKETWRA